MNRNVDGNEKKNSILHVAVVTSFITTFMGSALNLSIPGLENYFDVSGALIGWIVTAYTLSVAAFSVPLGKVADVVGRKKILALGLMIFTGMSVACTFSGTIWVMLILRVLQGIGAAMIFATNNAILINAYPASQRGRVLGISTAAVYIGLSVGPVAGGFLNSYLGWQSIFIATGIIGVIALVMSIKGIPMDMGEESFGKTDIKGNIFYILSISFSLYGLTNLSIAKYSWVILVVGLLFGVMFVLVEIRCSNPVIRVSMFSEDPVFTLSNLSALLNYGATFTISYLISIYLQIVMGYSSQMAGLILIAGPLMQAFFSPMMGNLSDRVAPYKLASMGMGLCAIGLIIFAFVNVNTPLWIIILTLMITGFGFALFSSPNTNAIMGCVQSKDYSVANSILATMRTVGHSSSMAIVTIVVGMTMGQLPLAKAAPEQLVSAMQKCFIIFIVLCISGVFMSMKRKKEPTL